MSVERKTPYPCGVCSIHKKTGNLVVERTNSTVRKFETIYRRGLRSETREAIRNAKCRDCGCSLKHPDFGYLNKKQKFKKKFCGSLHWEDIGAAIVVVIMAFAVPLALYLVRRYNRTFAYGAGGCVSTAFYTYDDCQILS